MKRFLAMLFSLFVSITNNVSPQFSGGDEFQYDVYYQITSTQRPDYKKLYASGVQLTSADNCTTTTRMGQDLNLIKSTGTSGLSAYLYMSDAEKAHTAQSFNSSNSYTFTEAGDIIAPVNCKVVTEPTSGGGHYMRLDSLDGKYSFVIENMERWYCCRYRKEAPANDGAWVHSVDISNETIHAGQLIGLAKDGTIIKVFDTESGLAISWYTFYNR